MSKKLLSMVLVIAMVLSLMPMSFAEGEAALDKSGVYVEYDIMSHKGESGSLSEILTYDTTNGFFTWVAADISSINYHSSSKCIQLTAGHWLIFKINVPVAGMYDIKIKNHLGSTGGYLDAYIFPDTVTPNADALSGDNYIGRVDCRNIDGANNGAKEGKPNPFLKDRENASYTFPTAGEYYIGFDVTAATTNRTSGFVGNIVLDGGTGYALIGDMTITPESVELGASAQATVTAYRSDYASAVTNTNGVVASAVTAFTYDSSNKDVATVDSEGYITTSKAGKTTITATADGFTNSLSRELEVTAAKSGITVMYDIMSHKENGSGSLYQRLSYEKTNGFFTYAAASSTSFGYHSKTTCIQIPAGHWIIFKINVPAEGTYDVKIKNHVGNTGGELNAYIFSGNAKPDAEAFSDSNYIGSVDCSTATGIDGKENPNQLKDKAGNLVSYTFPTAGEYHIGFKPVGDGKTGFVGDIVLVGGIGNALMGLNQKEIAIGTTDTIKAYLSSTAAEVAGNVTYESDNLSVAKVENGEIKAVGYGDANITVTYSGADVLSDMNSFVTKVSVKDAKLRNTVQVYIDALEGGSVTKSTNDTIANIEAGTLVTVEAVVDEGYAFSHWKDSEGKFVSDSSPYSFRPYVNTSLIAVFDKTTVAEGDTKTVYFYNGNGEYITEKTTKESSIEMPAPATLTGYIFDMWTADGVNKFDGTNIVRAITRVVAKYQENGKTYDAIAVNGETVIYDKAKDFNNNTATHWKRGGKTVAYGKDYKHYMWDAATIEAGTGTVEEIPVILLDEHSVENDFYMIEYDLPEGYTKLEAGILFGDDTHKTVDSCYYKAKSANKPETAKHGQFTATKSDDTQFAQTVVRGYLIYNDGTTNRVIYAEK